MIDLRKGDCLELMQDIPDKSIDAIIADLPYGSTNLKWDSIIPLEPLWEQYNRIIKDNGAIVLTATQPFTSALVMSNPKMFKHEWIWKKTHGGFTNAKIKPLSRHESVLVFSRGKSPYHPIKEVVTKGKIRDQRKEPSFNKNKKNRSDSPVNPNTKMGYAKDYKPNERYPISIIEFSNRKEKRVHPTQKPVALLEYLIKTYTNEGETVLDNTFGSCTCGVACVNTNRNFIGIEKDENYFNIGKERIKKHLDNNKQYTIFTV